jgi:hypothetical protein
VSREEGRAAVPEVALAGGAVGMEENQAEGGTAGVLRGTAGVLRGTAGARVGEPAGKATAAGARAGAEAGVVREVRAVAEAAAMAAEARARVGAVMAAEAAGDVRGAGARASLCSRRRRYSPSRRSRRRLRPRLGPACSRRPARHKSLGKGRRVRTLSSSVDPRSSETAAGGAAAAAAAAAARARAAEARARVEAKGA